MERKDKDRQGQIRTDKERQGKERNNGMEWKGRFNVSK
jgi:hypothetical protein